MRCEEMPDLLSAVVDGEAGVRERALVDDHLSDCAACRRELRLLRGMKAAIRPVDSPPIPAGLKAALLREAARRKPSVARGVWPGLAERLRVRPLRYGLAAAFSAAVLLIALRFSAGRDEEVPLAAMLAAHDDYALTMPLAPREQIYCRLSEAIAAEGMTDEL